MVDHNERCLDWVKELLALIAQTHPKSQSVINHQDILFVKKPESAKTYLLPILPNPDACHTYQEQSGRAGKNYNNYMLDI